ncbi:serine/threonine-protein kinase [Arthrobacter sp.]|uniref:serine/threonine-protein kinase n=1 Tax=Arthrobacter sp. TaxID=1667 RepID=UPI003A9273E9
MDAPNTTTSRPVLEEWSVESEIGSGAGGTVYVVRHRQTGERAALKVPTTWGNDDLAAAEVSALASMKHQHIVDLIGTVRTDQGTAILMEYLPGGSIADLIAARGPLGLGEAVTVVAPIASALAYLHEHGGVHGDVAPGNVLFTAAGMPKLADLGLAVLVGGRQTDSGTPGFRAPVTVDDESSGRRLRPDRDVYSLAALAWYMVTGRIAGPTQQRPPLSSLLGSVPRQLVELLEEGLSEDEQRRPTAAEFNRRIFEVAKPQPVSLRDAVRPEALSQMVTHVVAGASARPGRNPWAWIRARATRRQPGSLPSRLRFQGLRGRQRARSRPERTRESGTSAVAGRWRHRRVMWVAAGALVVAGLAAGGAGVLGNQQAGSQPPGADGTPTAAAATDPGTREPEASGAKTPAGAASAPTAQQALDDEQFRRAVPRDPLAAAQVLSGRRDLALAAADAAALRQVHSRHGSSLGPDLAKASQLRAQGLHYQGLSTRLSDATVHKGATHGTVDVVVTSTMGAYEVVGADGAIVARIEAPRAQRVTLRLADTDGGWRIAGVFEAAETEKAAS